jgi:cytochrome c-type biogenesis protein CcmH/NrfG
MAAELAIEGGAATAIARSRVYMMAGFCLAVGLSIGWLMRGSQQAVLSPHATSHGSLQSANATPAGHPVTLEQMKQMADQHAAPLLDKLKSNPNDDAVLLQVGAIYHTSHQFQRAAEYYGRAVDADPKNVPARTKLASSLYRSGDVDGAIKQLEMALTYDPKDAYALFDMGMIKLQGKGDNKGAVAAWRRLLKTNPQLSEDRKAVVMKLMANAMTMMGDQHGRGSLQ